MDKLLVVSLRAASDVFRSYQSPAFPSHIADRPLEPRSVQRLSDAFRAHGQFPIGDLAPLACNIRALEAASDFARGVHNQVVIIGPSGWGKSHLLRSAAHAIRLYQDRPVVVADAATWALAQRRVKDAAPLILDDVQDVIRHARARHCLRDCLARRSEFGRPTLLGFNALRMCRDLHELLPVSAPWVCATIKEPDVQDREIVVRQIARKEGVVLSRAARRTIARMVAGNARSIEGAMRRLRLVTDDWSEPASVLPLCGLVMPYVVDGTEWDPREIVASVATGVLEGTVAGRKVVKEITAFILCRDMGLSESDVAAYVELPPGEVYRWVAIVEELLVQPEVERAVQACQNAVLQSLCQL